MCVCGVWCVCGVYGVCGVYVWCAVCVWCVKGITNKDLLYSTWDSAECYVATWMGGEFGGERLYVYVWLSPFVVHLKLP